MNPRIRDFLIGLTAILGIAGLAITLFLIGDVQTRRTYALEVRLDTAGGLSNVSPVTLNGVKVGTIKRIAPAENPYDGVALTVHLFEGTKVPRDVKVAIDRSFVGDSTLSLVTPAGGTPDGGFFQPNETIRGRASSLLDQIGSLLDERLGTLEAAADSFQKLSDTYTRVGERIEGMLTPQDSAAVESGEVRANIATAVEQVQRAAASIDAWLGDEQMLADARRAVSKAATLVDQTAEAVETFSATAKTVNDEAVRLGDNAGALVREFAALSENVGLAIGDARLMLGRINDGEGTAGLLINNPDLYRALTDAARRLEKALTEAQLLVEKYRKEGIPIQW
ncbi:MAG: MCE family protein [Phycisphaerales bacterium]|nr:MCE family protein [Phycisphaerales bacterium]